MSNNSSDALQLLTRAAYNLTQLLADVGDERGGPISFTETQKIAFEEFDRFRQQVCINNGLSAESSRAYLFKADDERGFNDNKPNDSGQFSS